MSYLDAYKRQYQFQDPMAAGSYASNLALGMDGHRFGAAAASQPTSGGGIGGLGQGLSGLGGLVSGVGGLFAKGGIFAAV
jgi:hypothetical protein